MKNLLGSLSDGGYSKGESGTYRLVRTLCKSVQTRGCEKSGRISDFASYLKCDVGLPSVPFITFKGNRFNVLFYNGGVTYFLYKHCLHFFDLVKDDNKLLKAVYLDLNVSAYISGCRALGLINKFVTGPLWRLLESGIHVLDLNSHYQKMARLFSDLSNDATEFIQGNVVFFDSVGLHTDEILESLIVPSEEFDESTKQCLELLFGSLSIVTKRMLNDHLEGGKYDGFNENLRKETVSVSTTNSLAERNFGMLDRLIREKPNANMIVYEAIIMNRTNKTTDWRDKLSHEKKTMLMKWARESTGRQYNDYKARREEILKTKNEKRHNKLEEKKKREIKLSLVKENLCALVSNFGGLWLTEEQVDERLKMLENETKKREALKCQLQFRQKIILSSPSVNKKLFCLSEKGKLKAIDELSQNLKLLISQLRKDKDHIGKEDSLQELSCVMSKVTLDKEKLRLKELLDLETEKLNGPSKPKKRKTKNVSFDCPVITSAGDLVGKRVRHFTFGYDGKSIWHPGIVVCMKPGNERELVIRYDCEDKLYTFPFSDFQDNLVKLVPLKSTFLVGKKIRQCSFSDNDESDSWWEAGIVVGISENELECTVNFLNCDDEGQDLDVLTYPFRDDYLNHDFQLL